MPSKHKILEIGKHQINISGGFTTPKVSTNKTIKHILSRKSPSSIVTKIDVSNIGDNKQQQYTPLLEQLQANSKTPLNLSAKKSKGVIVKHPPKMRYKPSSHQLQGLYDGSDV